MPRTSHKKPYPIERYLKRIKEFYDTHGRVPLSHECGQSTFRVLATRGIAWQQAVEKATGKKAHYTFKSDDDVANMLRAKREELHRLPHPDDLSRGERALVEKRFKNLTVANETIFNDSERVRVLLMLNQLTPPGCDNATTAEIVGEFAKQGKQVSVYVVRGLLFYSFRENYVRTGRYDRLAWWSLTNEGKQFIKQFKGERNVNRAQ
ncbi:MAG: hypothetical protein HYV29_01685 [Ignavibacteriales bacterium]|nr:hypothetical protein [Ignavibacteriales bacterium]